MAFSLDSRFAIVQRGSTVRTEVLGGVTTFVTMAYIVVVNPAILSFAGIPVGPSTVATILAAAFGSLLMGLYANRPIAVAPYMGENAFIAFGLAAIGITWEQRLGAVFLSGLLFLVITWLGVRQWLAAAISPTLRASFAVGIGMFLALIGLYEAGVVQSFVTGMPPAALVDAGTGALRAPDVPVKLGNLGDPRVRLAVFGFVLMAALMVRRVKGALLIGIATTAAVGALLGYGQAPKGILALPFTGEYTLAPIALKLDVAGVLQPVLLPVLLTLFLMAFLDTLGTLVGLGVGDQDPKELERPMLVDAVTCTVSGLLGTSTSGAYIESAAGIREGARTGLAAVVTALLFLGCLFFLPLVEPLQRLRYAYAPALVVVGVLMLAEARRFDFDDLTELIPAFATLCLMVFTYNIANGLTAGLVLWPLMKAFAGRRREVSAGAWTLAALCASYLVFGLPH